MTPRSQVAWQRPDGVWRAFEPTPEELADRSVLLAEAYNEPHNRAMMDNRQDLSPAEVVELWQDMWQRGGRPFLLQRGQEWIGDADFRRIAGGRAEFAIMVGSRARQGKGVGTTFAVMLHGLAFRVWGLERVYVTILPANIASQRMFLKLGYVIDNSPEARSYADQDDDVSMSCGYEQLAAAHGAKLEELQFSEG